MGNRVHLELRGSGLPYLTEEDEEAVVGLTANNGLPLFWFALLREEHLGGTWEREFRTAFADPEEHAVDPIRLGWREARANLTSACRLAEARLPGLAPALRAWEAGIVTLAGRGPSQEVRLYLAEHANFYDSADAFLDALHRAVRIWHGPGRPEMPPVGDASSDLTGVDRQTDRPFPEVLPDWQPGRPVPGLSAGGRNTTGGAAEWGMVALFSGVVLGAAWLCGALLGRGGMWAGGGLAFLAGCVAVWRWAKAFPPG
ncbi:hypothetical protein [Muricoccus aerilatus]|uniref:hypothetical protein n=1 Tax=Muricoccus aerilatus TaxID=452982 RepID=UPI0005C16B7D|nr:hypothetical protein [Roseomonas aerilata]